MLWRVVKQKASDLDPKTLTHGLGKESDLIGAPPGRWKALTEGPDGMCGTLALTINRSTLSPSGDIKVNLFEECAP